MNFKLCNTCALEKQLTEFYSDKSAKDGYRGCCKLCQNLKHAEKRKLIRAGCGVKAVENKVCNRCKELKPASGFFKDAANGDGLYSICKVCKTQSTNKWRDDNREHYNAYMKNKNKEHYPKDRIRRYGLKPEQHEQMISDQKNVCAICGGNPPDGKPLVIDHCPNKGTVRGLLCYTCNRDMSILDKAEKLKKCVAYKNKNS